MERILHAGHLYKHFKGHIYKVIDTAISADDLLEYVIYEDAINHKKWIRKKTEFLSEVDVSKYPDVKQKYRFEEIT